MKKEYKWGIFVTAALIMLFLLFFLFGEIRLFRKGYNLYVKYNFTNGLSTNAPVRLAGVDIGTVENVRMDYDEDEKVYILVKLWIKEDVRLKKDAKFYINTLGLLGEKYVEITPGSKNLGIIPKNDTVVGADTLSTKELYSKGKDLAEDIEEILSSLTRLMSEESFDTFAKSFKSVREAMDQTTSMVKENRANLKNATKNLRITTSKLPKITQNLETLTSTLNKGINGKEKKIGDIIDNTDKLSKDLSELVTHLKKMEKSEGTAGKLINDDEAYNNLKNATKELEELVKDMKKNPKKYFKNFKMSLF